MMKSAIPLLLTLLTLAGQCPAQSSPQVDAKTIADLADRMNHMTSTYYLDGFNFGKELAALPSPVGFEILRDNWNKGASIESRKQMFKGFVFSDHPDAIQVLDLGMRDSDEGMQAWSMEYLKDDAHVDFTNNRDAYPTWFDKHKHEKLSEVAAKTEDDGAAGIVTTSTKSFGAALVNVGFEEGESSPTGWNKGASINGVSYIWDADAHHGGNRSISIKKTAGTYMQIAQWWQGITYDGKSSAIQFQGWMKAADAGKAVLDVQFLDDKGVMISHHWVVYVGAKKGGDPPANFDWKRVGGVAKVPDRTKSILLALQDYGPGQVWLDDVAARFADAAETDPLAESLVLAKTTPQASAQPLPDVDDVKNVPARVYYVRGDPKKEYVVIGKEGASAAKLLIVMPGGDGSVDFHPFVKRILKFGLGDGWIEAQPVAPAWTSDDNRVVWPAKNSPYAPAKFTTEEFIDSMLDEIMKRSKVEEVYMLGWSSSGPAIYSYAAHGKHSIAGAFVAMSIFKQDLFGNVKSLQVKRFYILHSPQDFIPIAQAERAKSAIEKLGLPVKLDQYVGGHGWHGPVYDEIRTGIAFLTARGNAGT